MAEAARTKAALSVNVVGLARKPAKVCATQVLNLNLVPTVDLRAMESRL